MLNYQLTGNGTPVVLIHGLFGDLDNLKALGNCLNQHQVIRIDVPNHGNSPHWPTMSYPDLAKALIALLDELAIKQAHFVGHSMGGKIAMAVALLYPNRVTSLTVADIAPVAYHARHHGVFAALNSLDIANLTDRNAALQQLIKQNIDAATAQFLLKNLQRETTGFSWRMNLYALEHNYNALIGWDLGQSEQRSYSGPTLCLRGAESDYVTEQHTQAFTSQFPAIRAKTLAATGHWLHVQKPAIFNRLVSEFIANNE